MVSWCRLVVGVVPLFYIMRSLACLQLDYLQQKTRDLEAKLDEAHAAELAAKRAAADVRAERGDLELSLKDADRTAKRLELDRDAVIGVRGSTGVLAKV